LLFDVYLLLSLMIQLLSFFLHTFLLALINQLIYLRTHTHTHTYTQRLQCHKDTQANHAKKSARPFPPHHLEFYTHTHHHHLPKQ
jgi:hypothetical protein